MHPRTLPGPPRNDHRDKEDEYRKAEITWMHKVEVLMILKIGNKPTNTGNGKGNEVHAGTIDSKGFSMPFVLSKSDQLSAERTLVDSP